MSKTKKGDCLWCSRLLAGDMVYVILTDGVAVYRDSTVEQSREWTSLDCQLETGQPRDDTGHNVSLPLQNKIPEKEKEQPSGELTECDNPRQLYE